ncbi:hypothetical protein Tco_1441650 [Tanacetum coccineum]
MDFRSFMMEGVDGEFNFLPEGGLDEEGNSPSTWSINNETPAIDAKPITIVHPLEFAKNIGDSDDAPSKMDEVTLIEFPSAKELKDFFDCHWVVTHVTSYSSWKQHFKEISMEKPSTLHTDLHADKPASCDAFQEREVVKDKAYAKLKGKSTGFVCSDEMGLLVARLVKVAMFHGKCTAFEKVADLKEPFILENILGYRPSSGKEFD